MARQFTREEKDRAHFTNIADIIRAQGGTLKKSGNQEVWTDDNGHAVTVKGNVWYSHYERQGGDAISFVKRFMGKTYAEAVEFIIGDNSTAFTTQKAAPAPTEPKGPFSLPAPCDNIKRVYAYLLGTRGLSKDVVQTFLKNKMIYESADYHNCVFVGFDRDGRAKHAAVRGTGKSQFRGNVPSSEPAYSFHWHGKSEWLFAFESPIDMLSYITMHPDNWQEHSYAACCGVGEQVIHQMMADNPNIHFVNLCFDNDDQGRQANCRIAYDLDEQKRIISTIYTPTGKDWNEDLLSARAAEAAETTSEEVTECPPSQSFVS